MIWKAYLDHAYAQNLAEPPLMRICCEFENRRVLRALSRKFLRQKSCYPESFRFLWLCTQAIINSNARPGFKAPEYGSRSAETSGYRSVLWLWRQGWETATTCYRHVLWDNKLLLLLWIWRQGWEARCNFIWELPRMGGVVWQTFLMGDRRILHIRSIFPFHHKKVYTVHIPCTLPWDRAEHRIGQRW